jgi:uncharacterized protein YukE
VSVRNLGDWSPLDLDKDPIYTDVERIEEARKRYQKIAVTIDDAIKRLKKIVDAGSESLAGQYVEGLKSEATSIRDNLTKAKTRYDDVAGEIKKYQPNLQLALDDTKKALTAARDAKTARSTADAMADPQPAGDGTISPEENTKGELKKRAIEDAGSDLTTAKTKLTDAMTALNTAGKSFGDAVNSKRYNDGLSDSGWDKFINGLKIAAKVFAWIGIAIGILAIFIPGVGVIVAGLIAGAITLGLEIALYKYGEGSIADVVIAAVGLGLFAVAGAAVLRGLGGVARGPNTAIELRPLPPRVDFAGPGGRPAAGPGLQAPGGPIVVGTTNVTHPPIGIFGALAWDFKNLTGFWQLLTSAPATFLKNWGALVTGLQSVPGLATLLGVSGAGIFANGLGVTIAIFGIGNVIYTALRQDYPGRDDPVIPDVNR